MARYAYGPPPVRRSRGPWIAVLTVLGLGVVAVITAGVLIYLKDRPSPISVSGSVTLGTGFDTTGKTCSGTGGYDDIVAGSAVVIRDDAGKTIAVGALRSGNGIELAGSMPMKCQFFFAVPKVPRSKFYTIAVGHRNAVTFPFAQVNSGTVSLTIGS